MFGFEKILRCKRGWNLLEILFNCICQMLYVSRFFFYLHFFSWTPYGWKLLVWHSGVQLNLLNSTGGYSKYLQNFPAIKLVEGLPLFSVKWSGIFRAIFLHAGNILFQILYEFGCCVAFWNLHLIFTACLVQLKCIMA